MHELTLDEAAIRLLYAMVGAAIYASAAILKNREKYGDDVNKHRVIATLLVGAGLGALAVATHQDPSPEWVAAQLLMYAGAVGIVEDVVKAAWARWGSIEIEYKGFE